MAMDPLPALVLVLADLWASALEPMEPSNRLHIIVTEALDVIRSVCHLHPHQRPYFLFLFFCRDAGR